MTTKWHRRRGTLRSCRAIAALFGAVLLCTVAYLALPGTALAHSQLLSSDPPAGASLSSPPSRIDLRFSEAVAPQFSSIGLYSEDQTEVPHGALSQSAGEQTLGAAIARSLPPGTYTVIWRVVSATDGHLTAGSFGFSVQGAPGETTPIPGTAVAPPPGFTPASVQKEAPPAGLERWLLRAVILALSALLAGGPLFAVLVLEPAASEADRLGTTIWTDATIRFARVGWAAAGALVVALLLDLVAEVSTISGAEIGGVLRHMDLLSTLIGSTRYGLAWLLRLIAASLLFLLFAWLASQHRRRNRRSGTGLWEVCIGAGSFLLLAEALSSHAAATEGVQFLGLPLPVISDWLHLVSASAWAGGLAFIAIALYPALRGAGHDRSPTRSFLALTMPRFSLLAVISVGLLGVTGIYNVAVHSTDLARIVSVTYGLVLATKVGLYVALVGLGAWNLLRLQPRLAAEPGDGAPDEPEGTMGPAARLRRSISVELVILAGVFVSAAGLTLLPLPPAAQLQSTHAAGAVTVATPTAAAQPQATSRLRNGELQLAPQASTSGDADRLRSEMSGPQRRPRPYRTSPK